MPNPGGLFLGCEICRRRKIKCDRSQPECRRCIKYGSPCPGYPREQDVRFRNETAKTVRKSIRVVPNLCCSSSKRLSSCASSKPMVSDVQMNNTTDSSTFAKDHDDHSRQSSRVVEWSATSTLLACSFNVSWEAVLAQYFFDQIIMSVGWYSYLPHFYHQSQSNSCINVTIAAASSFLAANQFQDDSMLRRAIHQYGIALQAIGTAIAHPKRSLEDHTLFSILLLNVLDDLTGQKSCRSGSHLNGCAALLKLRDAKGFSSKYTPHLAHSIVIQTQQRLMLGYKLGANTPEDETFLSWLWSQSLPTPAAKLSALSFEVGKIKDAATKMFDCSSICEGEQEHNLSASSAAIDALDADLVKWRTWNEPRWTQKSATLGHRSDESCQKYYYSDVQVSKVWNHWRIARIILHDTNCAIIDHLQSINAQCSQDQHDWGIVRSGSLSIISDMLSDIIASVPFHMQELDARGRPSSGHSQRVLGGCALIWPLYMVLQCAWASPAHKIDAARALRMIGDVVGVKQALVYLQSV